MLRKTLLCGIASASIGLCSLAIVSTPAEAKTVKVVNDSDELIVAAYARNSNTGWLSDDILVGAIRPHRTGLVEVPNDNCGPWRIGFDRPDNGERKYDIDEICRLNSIPIHEYDQVFYNRPGESHGGILATGGGVHPVSD